RIEEIRVGDKVWARDTVTGRDEVALVAETFVRTSTELFHLTIGGQVVSTTAEHPFWVQGRGWVDAAFLRTGDLLVTPEGATLPLQDVQTEQRTDPDAETVYNFHVETHHTYYVYAGDTPVLVHNAAHQKAISMDEAIELGTKHVAPDAKVVMSGSRAVQYVSQTVDDAGRTITKITRFDVNPHVPHVQKLGPHLNLETQINGRPVRSGPDADPHIPVDPATIKPGDHYGPKGS
ncbi:polymorphic toxin-type HINT domain-containing protein, partial [Promicromonospora citrea]